MGAGIATRRGLGLLLIGVSTGLWLLAQRIWFWGWAAGGLLLCWGLFSTGDQQNQWERPD